MLRGAWGSRTDFAMEFVCRLSLDLNVWRWLRKVYYTKEAGWEGEGKDVVRMNFSVDSLTGWHWLACTCKHKENPLRIEEVEELRLNIILCPRPRIKQLCYEPRIQHYFNLNSSHKIEEEINQVQSFLQSLSTSPPSVTFDSSLFSQTPISDFLQIRKSFSKV